jgi:hypothetical protein
LMPPILAVAWLGAPHRSAGISWGSGLTDSGSALG